MVVNKTAQIFAQENLPTLFLHDYKSARTIAIIENVLTPGSKVAITLLKPG